MSRSMPLQKHSWPGLVGWGADGDRVRAAGSGEAGKDSPQLPQLKKNGTSMSSVDSLLIW